jgi:Ser-tRNA(Ala) deacylase AlaX
VERIATSIQDAKQTRLLYYEDAYQKEFRAKVLAVQTMNGQCKVLLDKTAFYPTGGGQPSDRGVISGPRGEATVAEARFENGMVTHIAQLKGTINEGDQVTCVIDWNRRFALMRNHTLAHLMAEAVRKATGLNIRVVGSGLDVDKARLDLAHEGSLGSLFTEIQRIAKGVISENRPVEIKTMKRQEADEYVARYHESLKTLPMEVQNVRIVEIKNWHACACGGTHVKNVGEIGAAELLRRMSKGKGVERLEFRAKAS